MNDSKRHSRGIRRSGEQCVIGATLALAWSSGCSWLGEVPIEDLGSTGGGISTPAPPPEKDFPEQIDPGFEGHWGGYVEDPFQRDELGRPLPAVFPSGSTEVTLDYRFEGESFTPAATLVFGAGPAPAPEAGVAYPAGVNHYFASYFRESSFDAPVVEGHQYPLTETSSRFAGYDPGNASLLTFPEFAAFEQWCSVQETVPRGDDVFNCVGGSGYAGGDPILGDPCVVFDSAGFPRNVDCNYMAMCLSDLCTCNEVGCSFAKAGPLSQVFFERHGDEIVGTLSGATLDSGRPGWYTPMGTLRLYRTDD